MEVQGAKVRRRAEFHPSVWGDYFIKNVSHDEKLLEAWSEQAEVLKEEVRSILATTTDKPSEKMVFIDVIIRLGIDYHFEEEINEVLEQAYNNYESLNFNNMDLFTSALRFRLLRQYGYNVSSDIFNKFKNGSKGNFNENLIHDPKGLLSLYEASFLSVHGEHILDEARSFPKTHLESMVSGHLVSPLADQVRHALNRPLHKGVPKHEQWHYISIYQQDEGRVEAVLKLAKLDFNILQKMYQEELKVISQWHKDMDFKTKLPFSRDRAIECYFWALGAFTEPQFALARKFLGKMIIVVAVLDDIYDMHGTMEELELFTKMIESWDTSMIKDLPNFLKFCFEALVNVLDEIEDETTKEGRPYCIHYAKEGLKHQVRSYLAEARWFDQHHVPNLEEYRSVGVQTTGHPFISIIFACGMGKIASKEVFEWLFSEPKILVASSDLCRLMDDIASHEFEQQRGHSASSVECYMKQYNVSKEEAYVELKKLVEMDWKDMNEGLLKPAAVPKQILSISVNLARVTDVLYKDFDGYTNSRTVTKDMITALLVNPIPLEE